MACPLCGTHCRCSYSGPGGRDASRLLADPDDFDRSEECFEASLSATYNQPEHRSRAATVAAAVQEWHPPVNGIENFQKDDWFAQGGAQEQRRDQESARWREEVSARVQAHRARRRRRQDGSLPLDFDAPMPEVSTQATAVWQEPAIRPRWDAEPVPEPQYAAQAQAYAIAEEPDAWEALRQEEEEMERRHAAEAESQPGKLIVFPRASTVAPIEELAEPVLDTPRILEADDEIVESAEPAQMSIRLESEEPAMDFELPLQVAPLGARIYAGVLDAIIVAGATAIFGMVFVTLERTLPEQRLLLASALLVPGIFWSIYQWLFLVYLGTTPGLEFAKLKLVTFEGEALSPVQRIGRAMAAMLSTVSLGMGFAWALLDQDHLGWHDRISRTHAQRK